MLLFIAETRGWRFVFVEKRKVNAMSTGQRNAQCSHHAPTVNKQRCAGTEASVAGAVLFERQKRQREKNRSTDLNPRPADRQSLAEHGNSSRRGEVPCAGGKL